MTSVVNKMKQQKRRRRMRVILERNATDDATHEHPIMNGGMRMIDTIINSN